MKAALAGKYKIGQRGSQYFSFLYKTDNKNSWKIKLSAFNLFSSLSQIYPTTPCRDKLNKKSAACLSMPNHFFFGAEMNAVEKYIARFSKL